MIRGTRLLMGDEANLYFDTCQTIRTKLKKLGFQEVYPSSMWDQQTFIDKAGPEIINQIYSFKDKGDRDIYLIRYSFSDTVKRSLSYYVEDGFEASVDYLGAQKQVAGGGRYAEGIGWAIGVDRLMLAQQRKTNE